MKRRTFLILAGGAAAAGLARVPELSGAVVEAVTGHAADVCRVALYCSQGPPIWFSDVPVSIDLATGVATMPDLTVSVFEKTEIVGASAFLPWVPFGSGGDKLTDAVVAFRFPTAPFMLHPGDSFTMATPRIAIQFD